MLLESAAALLWHYQCRPTHGFPPLGTSLVDGFARSLAGSARYFRRNLGSSLRCRYISQFVYLDVSPTRPIERDQCQEKAWFRAPVAATLIIPVFVDRFSEVIVHSSPCEIRLALKAFTPVALRKRFSRIPLGVGKTAKRPMQSTHNNLAGRNSFDCIMPPRTHSKTGSGSNSNADC